MFESLTRLPGRVLAHSSRVPELDGIRGLAILMVLVVHAHVWAGRPDVTLAGRNVTVFLINSRLGVNLFFVLSGYLLFGQFVDRFTRGLPQPTYRSFLHRRFNRILPAYYAFIFFGFFILPAANRYMRLDLLQGWQNLAAHLFFVHNFNRHFSGSYGVVWSLAVEMQFYILLPLIAALLLNGKAWRQKIIAGWALSTLLYVAISLFGDAVPFDIPWELSLPTHLSEFMAGFVMAAFVPFLKQHPRRSAISLLLQVSATLLILILMYLGSNQFIGAIDLDLVQNHLWYPLVGLSFAMLIAGAVTSDGILNRLWTSRLMVFLGIVSYGMFLWHWLIMPNIGGLETVKGFGALTRVILIFAAALPLSAAVGYFSYVFVELPFLKSKKEEQPSRPQRVESRSAATPSRVPSAATQRNPSHAEPAQQVEDFANSN